RHFFSHHGIDPKGILRAAWANLRSGDVRQGGSTLTQQLVKNFFLTHERTLLRKFNEMIMALLLEWHYSKAEILATYINEIYLGQHGAQGIHGFGTAAEYYFSRPLSELKLEQLALLVALVRGASYYNPRKHPERATERRNLVIQQMYEQGYLEEEQAIEAQQAPLLISDSPGWSSAKYPAFLDLVNRQLARDYRHEDLQTEGLRIFTTLNPLYQETAIQAASSRLSRLEKSRGLKKNTIQVAGIITSVDTGEVLAMLGGRDNHSTGFNRALDAKRQVGSLIKPVIYLTALSKPERYNVLTALNDKSVSVKQNDGTVWKPDNYDGEIHGEVPMYLALEKSYNLATVRLGMEVGIAGFRKTLGKLGVNEHIPGYPSVYLGAIGLSPLQVTQMYQTLASEGFEIPLRTIREILDKNGNPLQRYPLDIRQMIDSRPVFLTNFLLTRVVQSGTARSLAARMPSYMPLAGKTGTTNDLRDSWFAGFGDNLLGVVWMGRDDNKPAGLTGSSGALQLWTDIMQTIKPQPLTLIPPDGVSMLAFKDGQRVAEGCPGAREYPFIDPYYPAITPCSGSKPQTQTPDSKPWSIFDIFR
ncbi:MAG TPA: transglycosylase domain-containing protein, partial [Gammaproteobacteria bacterium]|nr:transglycosylase domain-containing protein [Gammaproteobacteria bacterium]